jgi:hypothetical protein
MATKAKKFRVLKPFMFRGVNRKVGDLMIIVEHKIPSIDSACIEEISDKEYEQEKEGGKPVKGAYIPAPETPKYNAPETPKDNNVPPTPSAE